RQQREPRKKLMDRNSLLRVLIIAAAVLLFWKFGMPMFTGSSDKTQSLPEEVYSNAPGFIADTIDPQQEKDGPNKPTDGELCVIHGNRFEATLSPRGAGIVKFNLDGGKYEGMDLSTTPDHERWRSLRTLFRGPDGKDQFKFDRFPWKVEP